MRRSAAMKCLNRGEGEIPDGHRWDSAPKIRFAPDLYGAFSVKRLIWVCCQFFVRSGKAVLRPVACDQVRGGTMNREMGLFEALASDGAYNVCVIVRGELAIGRIFAPHTCMR